MEPREFLAAVLPTAGHYCVAQFVRKKEAHTFSSTVDGMISTINRYEKKKYCTFFALSSFKTEDSRAATNAQFIRALFLDLDCSGSAGEDDVKVYQSRQAALAALDAFLRASGLPTPWLVSSGNGIHAYWPLTVNATIEEWKPIAENLKRLCIQHGLKIDPTVTADAARVLRVPGTHNWKKKNVKPLLCSVKYASDPTHFVLAELATTILATLEKPISTPSTLFDVPGERFTMPAPSLVPVNDNRVTFFKSIMSRTVAGKGCGQLSYYMEHASEDGMEPIWRGMLSLAMVCEDGTKATQFLSKLHPYADTRMHQKLREIKGPYPCVKLDSENPGVCTACPHWGKITNPLALGHEIQTDSGEKDVEIHVDMDTASSVVVKRPTPPHGYAYGAKGGVYRQVKEVDAEGEALVTNKQVLGYDLFAVDLLNDTDGHHVHLMAMRPEGPTSLVIPQRSVVSKDETVKALAEKNILASYGAGNDRYLFDYVRACTESISTSRKAVIVPTSFGWQRDNSFVLNNTVYTGGKEKIVPIPKLANIISFTESGGTFDDWKKVFNLIISKKYYDVLSMAMVGFGSPLMKFTGFEALTFHIGSSDSGTGKSLALNMASSVWGDKRYIMNPKASGLMQEHRAGSLGNLPLIIDEITEANEDFKWMASFVMDMTSGIGKERLKNSVNEERVNTTFWCALMLLASNKHATDFFSSVRKQESRGHLARLLEIKMDKIITWSSEEEDIIQLLKENYGHAGKRFAKWLAANRETAQRVTMQVYKEFRAEVNGVGGERFWVAGCAACIAAAILIGKQYANIVDIPVKGITEVYKKMIEEARVVVSTNVRTAEDILNSYTREFFGGFVVMYIHDQTKKFVTTRGDSSIIDGSITRAQVRGRVEHDKVPGFVRYYIEETQLRAWCSSLNYGYADFLKKLEAEFAVVRTKKDMLSGTRGPQMRVSALQITRPESSVLEDFAKPAVPVE